MQLAIEDVLPYGVGNVSPRFFGWVHGSQSEVALPAAVIASALNANVGGRNHAAVHVEKALIEWCLLEFGMSEGATGVCTSGTSEGNLLGLYLARQRWSRGGVKDASGEADYPRPIAIVNEATHDSVFRALRILDVDFVAAPSNLDGTYDLNQLGQLLRSLDRSGRPVCALVGTAGYIDSGCCDRLDVLHGMARDRGIWFHVDGAFGAWLKLAGGILESRVHGLADSDSLAFDFHKWLPVPFAVGALLVQNGDEQLRMFGGRASYLDPFGNGITGAEPWAVDLGFALSRGAASLTAAMVVMAEGTDALGSGIAHCVSLAQEFAGQASTFGYELVSDSFVNVVLIRPRCEACTERPIRIHEIADRVANSGRAVLSTTTVGGKPVLRACFVNHYSRISDVIELLDCLATEHRSICGTHLR